MAAPDLASSPELYPLATTPDGGGLGLVRMDEAAYRTASFLDARILTAGRETSFASWTEATRAAVAPPARADFIFHISHVGSTLLSRLLGEHPAVFSVREPALLREAVGGGFAHRLEPILALLSRTWRPGQTALIKATSFVSEIGRELLAASPDNHTILLGATPPTYLRTILAGLASRQENAALAEHRRARLERRLRGAAPTAGEGERIAMSWLCETLSLHDVAAASVGALWLDFDCFLQQPAATLRAAFTHQGADPDAIDIAALVEGPLMRRYSKGPEHAYDVDLRRALLAQADRESAGDIRAGMEWLQRMAQAHPAVMDALKHSAAVARAPLADAARRL